MKNGGHGKEGGRFMTILNDYKKVANVEAKKNFLSYRTIWL